MPSTNRPTTHQLILIFFSLFFYLQVNIAALLRDSHVIDSPRRCRKLSQKFNLPAVATTKLKKSIDYYQCEVFDILI